MVAAGDLPFLDKLGMCFPQLSFCTLMHIVCAIQESVLNFHMKDLLFFSHDSFSPSSTLSYAGMCTHTRLVSHFCFMSCSPIPPLSLPLSMKSPYQESDTCFRKSQKLLLSWPSKVLLKQDFIPESWRHLRSRRLTGDTHSRWGCQGWTIIFIPWRICLLRCGHGRISFQLDAN